MEDHGRCEECENEHLFENMDECKHCGKLLCLDCLQIHKAETGADREFGPGILYEVSDGKKYRICDTDSFVIKGHK